MIKGLLVIRESGTPAYCYLQDRVTDDEEVLISGFLAAMQMFAKDMFSREKNEIQSVALSKTVFTFRTLTLNDVAQKPINYHFVLLTESEKKPQAELDSMLEYLIVSFLGFENGDFRRKLRRETVMAGEFSGFDDYVSKIVKTDWNAMKKKVKPIPGSVIQGLLYELRNYIPVSQIQSLHPRLVRIGPSYVWLSDDLPEQDERALVDEIKRQLTKMFGPGVFESVLADVQKRISG